MNAFLAAARYYGLCTLFGKLRSTVFVHKIAVSNMVCHAEVGGCGSVRARAGNGKRAAAKRL